MTNKEKLSPFIIANPIIVKNSKYIGSIYVLYNTQNDKVYIGKTIQNYTKRWYRHKCNASLGWDGFLYNAIRKYGWDAFEKYVIYQTDVLDNEDAINLTLNQKEQYFIKYFNSQNRNLGYNICDGGEGRKGDRNHASSIPIYQCDLQGKIIKEWPSMHEVERQLGYDSKEISYFMYTSKRKSSYKGYLWIKKSQYFDGVFKNYVPRQQKVYCYDILGILLNTFESCNKAANFYNLTASDVVRCCSGKTLTANIYVFLTDPNEIQERLKKIQSNSRLYNKIKVKLLSNKKVCFYDIDKNLIKIYNNLQEIADEYKIRPNTIYSKIESDSALLVGGILVWEENKDKLDLKIKNAKATKSFSRDYKKYYFNGKHIKL